MLEFISKWGSFDVLKNGASVITKRDSFFYLKVWQALRKKDRHYKVKQVLQGGAITKRIFSIQNYHIGSQC